MGIKQGLEGEEEMKIRDIEKISDLKRVEFEELDKIEISKLSLEMEELEYILFSLYKNKGYESFNFKANLETVEKLMLLDLIEEVKEKRTCFCVKKVWDGDMEMSDEDIKKYCSDKCDLMTKYYFELKAIDKKYKGKGFNWVWEDYSYNCNLDGKIERNTKWNWGKFIVVEDEKMN